MLDFHAANHTDLRSTRKRGKRGVVGVVWRDKNWVVTAGAAYPVLVPGKRAEIWRAEK
jgi:hypothetical protein